MKRAWRWPAFVLGVAGLAAAGALAIAPARFLGVSNAAIAYSISPGWTDCSRLRARVWRCEVFDPGPSTTTPYLVDVDRKGGWRAVRQEPPDAFYPRPQVVTGRIGLADYVRPWTRRPDAFSASDRSRRRSPPSRC